VTDAPAERERESPWDRLRRRKVAHWGLLYVAGAWGFLQGLEYVGESFHWPDQVRQVALLSLLIGLPIVLVLAWYHGDRGEQRVSRIELALLTLLLLLGAFLFWHFEGPSETTSVATAPAATIPVAGDDHSIAVLPFVNISSDKEQEYFSDGLSEELLNSLSQVPGLRVIARTSSFSFKGKEVDVATIAKTLNVAHVLEGSVRKSGEKLRITAQLIRTSDSSHLWSRTYDRPLTDVFAVQDEIAGAVVSELKIKLLDGAPRKRVPDPRAYALFLQAREIGRQHTAEAYEHSISLYQQALEIDPEYVEAWDGLAVNYILQVDDGLRSPDVALRPAREALDKALAIDANYAPAYADLALISIYNYDLAAAASHLERALALGPADPAIMGNAAFLTRRLGQMDRAIAISEYQITLDPVNAIDHQDLGHSYRYDGRFNEALAAYRTALSLSPRYIGLRDSIGEVLLQQGDAKGALAEIQQETDEATRLVGLSMTYHALGRKVESDAALAELITKFEKSMSFGIAYVLAFRGEIDRSFEWLDKTVQYRNATLGAAPVYPMFASLHSDPRWLPFLRKHGMAPEQLASVKFDVTLPP
jgi:TolB-like protein/tetratricopeptide (TPR) repeat protein